MNPLVSVITAFYNEENFLSEAIESVLQQEYPNWELILVDDGSSDKSSRMAMDYAAAHPGRILYTEHPAHINRGLSASRNHGIAFAKGELIAFLDADDVWLPAKLRVQVDLMQLNPPCQMLCEASEYWHYDNAFQSRDKIVQVGKKQDKLYMPPELLKELYPLSTGKAPCPSGIIIRKSAILKHHGFEEQFDGKFQMYEDQAFLHKIYLNEPVYLSSACNNRYRQRNGSLVQKVTHDGQYHVVRIFFLEWLERYMSRIGFTDPDVVSLLNKALQPYRSPVRHSLKGLLNIRRYYQFLRRL